MFLRDLCGGKNADLLTSHHSRGEPTGDGGDDFAALGFVEFAVDGDAEHFAAEAVGDVAAGEGGSGEIGEAFLLIQGDGVIAQ